MKRAHLESLDGKQTDLALDIEHLNPATRLNRSLKTLGIFWGAAVLAVFIPMIHFVAVPVLLILGIIFAVRKWRRTEDIKARGECPACGYALVFDDLRANAQEYCPQCRHQSRVIFTE